MFVAALAEAGAAIGRADWVDDGRDDRRLPAGRPAAGRRPVAAVLAGRPGRAPPGLRRRLRLAGRRVHPAGRGHRPGPVDRRGPGAADDLLELFWDDDDGGPVHHRPRRRAADRAVQGPYDGATPSANSVAAVALLRLAALTGDDRYTATPAEPSCGCSTRMLARHPTAVTNLLAAVDLVVSGVTEVAVTGDRPDLVDAVQARYLPNAVLAWGEPYPSPLWEGRTGEAEAGKAFVCRDFTCGAPVADVEALLEQLAGLVG